MKIGSNTVITNATALTLGTGSSNALSATGGTETSGTLAGTTTNTGLIQGGTTSSVATTGTGGAFQSAAFTLSSAYATSAQGAKADAALVAATGTAADSSKLNGQSSSAYVSSTNGTLINPALSGSISRPPTDAPFMYLAPAFVNATPSINMFMPAISTDGVNFGGISDGQGVYAGSGNDSECRDASIIKVSGTYYLAYINNHATSDARSKKWGITTTTDLIHYTTSVDVDTSGFAHSSNPSLWAAWSPMLFQEPGISDYTGVHAYVTVDGTDNMTHIVEQHPTNTGMTAWSTPVDINVNGGVLAQDGCMVKSGSTYNMFTDNNGHIHHWVSTTSGTSGFSDLGQCNAAWASFEEASLVLVSGSHYRMFMDHSTAASDGAYYADSFDGMTTWSSESKCGNDGYQYTLCRVLPIRDLAMVNDILAARASFRKGAIIKFKNSDSSKASNTTYADDTDFSVWLPAGGRYAIDLKLRFATSSTVPGIKIALAYTGTSGMLGNGWHQNESDSRPFSIPAKSDVGELLNLSGMSAEVHYMEFHGFFIATTSGILSLQWAQSVSNSTQTTLQVGSQMVLTRLNP